jgi:hypothetical protein
MNEKPKHELYSEAISDVKAMHLLRASIVTGETPFEDWSRDLNLLSSPDFPIGEWWKSFDRLRTAGLIEVKDVHSIVVVVPSESGRRLIINEKFLAREGRTLTGSF